MAQQILVQRSGRFAYVSLNRPRLGNVVSDPMLVRLAQIVDELGADPKLKAVVLSGRGADFSLGRERPKKGAAKPRPAAYELHGRVMARILDVYRAFRDCPAPVIAKVRGRAVGFGCALIGGADLAISAASARFSLPEMAHGVAPTLAMSALSKVAPKALAQMVYSMDPIDAPTALAIGLVGEVAPDDALDDAVERLLARLEGYDVAQIRAVKRFMARGLGLEPGAAADLAGYTLATLSTRPR